jgi:ABC-type microcin C transport system permease subunit YejB
VSRLSDRVKKDNLLIAIGAFCVGVMMILLKLYPAGGLFLFIGMMAAMGVDNVFIDAIEEVYVASGRIPSVSEENLLQSYKTIEKIISVVIPTITGLCLLKLGFGWSMLAIGVWSAAGAILFAFLGKNGRWEKDGHA